MTCTLVHLGPNYLDVVRRFCGGLKVGEIRVATRPQGWHLPVHSARPAPDCYVMASYVPVGQTPTVAHPKLELWWPAEDRVYPVEVTLATGAVFRTCRVHREEGPSRATDIADLATQSSVIVFVEDWLESINRHFHDPHYEAPHLRD